MAKKKRKKSKIVPVLKFVGIAAAGGVIGGYSMRYWMRNVEPRLRGASGAIPNSDDDVFENPSPPMGVPQVQPFVMPQMPVMPVIPFPQFVPTPYPQPFAPPAPAPAPMDPPAVITTPPAAPAGVSRGAKMRQRREQREAESQELLDRIAADLNEYYSTG